MRPLLLLPFLAAAFLAAAAPASAAPTWLSPVTVSPSRSGDVTGATIASDDAGHVVAAWLRDDTAPGVTYSVDVSLRSPGGGFTPAATLSPAGVGADPPSVGIDASGTATVVWAEADTSVKAVRIAPDGTRSAVETVATGAGRRAARRRRAERRRGAHLARRRAGGGRDPRRRGGRVLRRHADLRRGRRQPREPAGRDRRGGRRRGGLAPQQHGRGEPPPRRRRLRRARERQHAVGQRRDRLARARARTGRARHRPVGVHRPDHPDGEPHDRAELRRRHVERRHAGVAAGLDRAVAVARARRAEHRDRGVARPGPDELARRAGGHPALGRLVHELPAAVGRRDRLRVAGRRRARRRRGRDLDRAQRRATRRAGGPARIRQPLRRGDRHHARQHRLRSVGDAVRCDARRRRPGQRGRDLVALPPDQPAPGRGSTTGAWRPRASTPRRRR